MIISYDNHKEYAFLWIDESVGTHICFVTPCSRMDNVCVPG